MAITLSSYDPTLFQGAAWYYVDSYLGYIYSTAFGLPSFFGENREKFETDLRASLLAVEPSREFTEELPVTALVARR